MSSIVCFGEVLWDVFPTYKKIGGAPLNVALRLKSFGNEVVMISAVGSDSEGKEILSFMEEKGLAKSEVQLSDAFRTSQVKVQLDKSGSATYTIEYPCAWDNIHLKESSKRLVAKYDAFIYGSLVTRHQISKGTLLKQLSIANFKVFDVNLRAPHYTMPILKQLMDAANFIKFNDDELLEICEHFEFQSNNLEANIKYIANKTNTNLVCVTLGSKGAIIFKDDKFYKSKGYSVTVKDTVGAGDSFLATLVDGILSDKNPQEALEVACAVGALVASKDGANPIVSMADVSKMISQS